MFKKALFLKLVGPVMPYLSNEQEHIKKEVLTSSYDNVKNIINEKYPYIYEIAENIAHPFDGSTYHEILYNNIIKKL